MTESCAHDLDTVSTYTETGDNGETLFCEWKVCNKCGEGFIVKTEV